MFFGPAAELAKAKGSLTADYLLRRKAGRDHPRAAPPREQAAAAFAAAGRRRAQPQEYRRRDSAAPLWSASPASAARASPPWCTTSCFRRCCAPRASPPKIPAATARSRAPNSIGDVVMVDQSRIGRTTRSNPASYVGAFDAIRDLFARLPQARERKYTAGTFSFNAGNGRCPGMRRQRLRARRDAVSLRRVPALSRLRWPALSGGSPRGAVVARRRAAEEHRRCSRSDRLRSAGFFAADADVCLRLAPLADVGLDYLRLGQPVPTLSGGEAQRLKLAGHLAENAVRRSFHAGHRCRAPQGLAVPVR